MGEYYRHQPVRAVKNGQAGTWYVDSLDPRGRIMLRREGELMTVRPDTLDSWQTESMTRADREGSWLEEAEEKLSGEQMDARGDVRRSE